MTEEPKPPPHTGNHVALGILFFVNLINWMDRVILAAILEDVTQFYSLSDKETGFLQTIFVIAFVIFAPLFGYTGDRYSRTGLIAAGLTIWNVGTLWGSIPPDRDSKHLFFATRALVGAGQASFSAIAPSLIGDFFPEDKRTMALGVYSFAVAIGAGSGYMVGAGLSALFGNWYWALRLTPILGAIAIVLFLAVLKEPQRGQADGAVSMPRTSLSEDLSYLCSNKSFVFATLGYTAAMFTLGALSWWMPNFLVRASDVHSPGSENTKIKLIFGAGTCLGGVSGVTLAVYLSRALRSRYQMVDPAICAAGVLLGIPSLGGALMLAATHPNVTWALLFLGFSALSINGALVPAMLMYTVIPTRRGIAAASQVFFSKTLGDAASPYLVGSISDTICGNCNRTMEPQAYFSSLRDAMLLSVSVLIIGTAFFVFNMFTISADRERCQEQMQGAKGAPSNSAKPSATKRRETSQSVASDIDIVPGDINIVSGDIDIVSGEIEPSQEYESKILSLSDI